MFGIFIKIAITSVIMIATGLLTMWRLNVLQDEKVESVDSEQEPDTTFEVVSAAAVITVLTFSLILFVVIMFFVWALPIGTGA
jgi:hypothetical protein